MSFRRVKPPSVAKLDGLIHRVSERVGRFLERQGLLVTDLENSYLTLEWRDDTALDNLSGHSITYRIAVGPHQGKKALRCAPSPHAGKMARTLGCRGRPGFHYTPVSPAAHQRDKLERLCRYIARPAIANERLALTCQGQVRYQFKTPYRDGATHGVFSPLDFITRLAALVPKPCVNLTRLHGVFAPNSCLRAGNNADKTVL